MTTLSDFNRYGEELEKILLLRTSPIAVKMLEKEEDIPQGAIRPKKDRGYHLAQCQAFALSRREKETVAMLKEDNWCPAPVMAYGLVEKPDDSRNREHRDYDCFEYGKYIGIVTAPLRSANFEPDVVIVYSNTSQLRSLLLAMKFEERASINSRFFPPSCAYSVVHVMLTGQYYVILPDPGEYQRALGDEGEMMFAIPGDKMEGLISDLIQFNENEFAYTRANMIMRPDFAHSELYKKLFRSWGMDTEE
jgi:uncharacterized protein (DUF169 family)